MQNTQHRKLKAALKRGFKKNRSARYPLERSPLWRLRSIHELARLLRTTPIGLKSIAAQPLYSRFIDKPESAKPRNVQEPRGQTMRLHYRLVRLLDSIERPAFLHSATRGRSSVTNAEAHRSSSGAIVKTDIRSFYERTTYTHVKAFFFRDLGWPHDLARLVASACTVDGHLPTGSCLSPLLSYYAHRRRFAAIEQLCDANGATMTLYVDDLTLSGPGATKRFLQIVKSHLQRSDLVCHKDQISRPSAATVVTGVVIAGNDLRLRNKHHLAITNTIDSVAAGDQSLVASLNGRIAAARSVDPSAAHKLKARLAERISRTKPT